MEEPGELEQPEKVLLSEQENLRGKLSIGRAL
jgi:hypothetical protein